MADRPRHDEGADGPRILVAVESADEGTRLARRVHDLFGDRARYTVLSVAAEGSVVWGGSALATGVAYPMVVPSAVTGLGGGIPVLAPVVPPTGDDPLGSAADEAERVAAAVAAGAALPGARTAGQAGDPADMIVTAAAHADVVVVGSHERGWFSRLLSPSVSSDVLRHSPVPVLVVPTEVDAEVVDAA